MTSLTPGSHTITTSFAGGASYQSSSGSMVQQVSAGRAAAVRVSPSPNPSQIGQVFVASVSVVPYAPAAGAATQTIVPASTTTSVVPSSATITAGQPVSFTVTVTSQFGGDLVPDGTVALLEDGLSIAGLESVAITSGRVTTAPVTITDDGLHTISAAYQPIGAPPIWASSSGST